MEINYKWIFIFFDNNPDNSVFEKGNVWLPKYSHCSKGAVYTGNKKKY